MPSAPEIRRRALALALCMLSVGGPTPAQRIRSPRQRPDMPQSGARRIARQVLPSVVLITMEGDCFGSFREMSEEGWGCENSEDHRADEDAIDQGARLDAVTSRLTVAYSGLTFIAG